jgi:2-phosphosulfolactate phosphatase
MILPYLWKDEQARAFASEHSAVLAGDMRTKDAYSLSPSSLTNITPGTRLVLSSRNGAVLSLQAAKRATTIAAYLRNAPAVATFLRERAGLVAIIAGGERWPDDTLRHAWEDLIAAGAIIAELPGSRSPEAAAATAAFHEAKSNLVERLAACSSGRELIERGFASDVDLAAAYGESRCVPVLGNGEFAAAKNSPWPKPKSPSCGS